MCIIYSVYASLLNQVCEFKFILPTKLMLNEKKKSLPLCLITNTSQLPFYLSFTISHRHYYPHFRSKITVIKEIIYLVISQLGGVRVSVKTQIYLTLWESSHFLCDIESQCPQNSWGTDFALINKLFLDHDAIYNAI